MHKLLHSGEKDYSMKEKRERRSSQRGFVGLGDGANGTEERRGKKIVYLVACESVNKVSAVVAGRRKGGADRQTDRGNQVVVLRSC